jgi:hypothetical protein
MFKWLVATFVLCLFVDYSCQQSLTDKYLIEQSAEALIVEGQYFPREENVNGSFWYVLSYQNNLTMRVLGFVLTIKHQCSIILRFGNHTPRANVEDHRTLA